MKSPTISRFWRTSGGLAGFLLVLGIIIAVNVILSNVRLKTDLTEEKLYTLSDGTRSAVDGLQNIVTLKLYFNRSSRELPTFIKGVATRVEDLLREYERCGRGRIVVETCDPEPDSEAEDWARRYGVAGQRLGGMGGPVLYLGLVAEAGGTPATIPVLDPRMEDLLEYKITRMILRVASPAKPVLGVLSSLPVLGRPGNPYAIPGQPRVEPQQPWFMFGDLRQDYEVRQIAGDVAEIGPDVSLLILVQPRSLSDKVLYAIDQFVLRGGRLLAFLDPVCVAETELGLANPYSPGESNMGRLLQTWGVEFDEQTAVTDIGSQYQEYPAVLGLRKANLNKNDPITSRLELMVLPIAGTFSVNEDVAANVTPLLQTSEQAGHISGMMARMMDPAGIREQHESGSKRLDVALRLHGKLKTAFPDGRPKDVEADNAEDTEKTDKPREETGLKESVEDSMVVLVADADMLYDRFSLRQMNFLGFVGYQPWNDNPVFFMNIVEQMAGGSDLVSIRTRGKIERPFEVVLEREKKAQQQWLDRQKMLQEKLRETEQKLNELQARQDGGQKLILTPEQEKAIEEFRKEELNTRKELKLVGRKLREDIERLGTLIKAINILLMPAVVALLGVAFWFTRRSRAKS